jgi:hypothetical protein
MHLLVAATAPPSSGIDVCALVSVAFTNDIWMRHLCFRCRSTCRCSTWKTDPAGDAKLESVQRPSDCHLGREGAKLYKLIANAHGDEITLKKADT